MHQPVILDYLQNAGVMNEKLGITETQIVRTPAPEDQTPAFGGKEVNVVATRTEPVIHHHRPPDAQDKTHLPSLDTDGQVAKSLRTSSPHESHALDEIKEELSNQAPLAPEPVADPNEGYWGKVKLVDDRVPHPRTETSKGILGVLIGFLKHEPKTPARTELEVLGSISDSVVYDGKVLQSDIDALPKNHSEYHKLRLANTLIAISAVYTQQRSRMESLHRTNLADEEPLILSDFIEVLPRHLAACVLLAASDPEIARTILKHEGTLAVRHSSDSQQAAIEAVSLLPQKVRLELFDEMARISPGTNGETFRFYKFLVSNWPHPTSSHSGMKFIHKALEHNPELEEAKTAEMADDIQTLGPRLRGTS